MALKPSLEKPNEIRGVMAEASLRAASSSGTPLVGETHGSTRLFWWLSDTIIRHLLLSKVLFSFQLVRVHDLCHVLNSVSTFQIDQANQIYLFLSSSSFIASFFGSLLQMLWPPLLGGSGWS